MQGFWSISLLNFSILWTFFPCFLKTCEYLIQAESLFGPSRFLWQRLLKLPDLFGHAHQTASGKVQLTRSSRLFHHLRVERTRGGGLEHGPGSRTRQRRFGASGSRLRIRAVHYERVGLVLSSGSHKGRRRFESGFRASKSASSSRRTEFRVGLGTVHLVTCGTNQITE